MNPIKKNHSSKLVPAAPQSAFNLDALIRVAIDGDREAMDAVARELHPRLVHEARQHLGTLEHEAEDVVQDLFVAMLEGRLRAPRGRGEALAMLLRMTKVIARRYCRGVDD